MELMSEIEAGAGRLGVALAGSVKRNPSHVEGQPLFPFCQTFDYLEGITLVNLNDRGAELQHHIEIAVSAWVAKEAPLRRLGLPCPIWLAQFSRVSSQDLHFARNRSPVQYLLDRQADTVPAVKAGVKYEKYPQNSTFFYLFCNALKAHAIKEGEA